MIDVKDVNLKGEAVTKKASNKFGYGKKAADAKNAKAGAKSGAGKTGAKKTTGTGKSGVKSSAGAGKSGAKVSGKAKDITAVMAKKPVRKIVEYFYFTEKEITCRDLLNATGTYDPKSDIWPDLNLMEVEMNYDSLIFQDATDCFEDEEDMKWFEANGIKTKYQISYDTGDIADVRGAMKEIMSRLGGVICSNTDDFKPMYRLEDLGKLN